METISATALREHIARLTTRGPRHRDNPAGVIAALDYLEGCLTAYGYVVRREAYGEALHEVNLVTGVDGAGPILEVGAHWDTVAGSPGADDNASGVAGLLELARVLADETRRLRFCLFGGEEEGLLGSAAHVAGLRECGETVDGAIVLEMIGYRDTAAGSQQVPAAIVPITTEDLIALGFDRGDFIAAVGDTDADDYLAALEAGGRAEGLRVLPVSLPRDHDAHGARSDHRPYWRSGRKGVMITDTAEFRNPHYHSPADTIDTVDGEFAATVTRAVAHALRALCR